MNASNHSLPQDLPWSQDPPQSVGNRASPLVIWEHPVPSIAIGQSARCGVANVPPCEHPIRTLATLLTAPTCRQSPIYTSQSTDTSFLEPLVTFISQDCGCPTGALRHALLGSITSTRRGLVLNQNCLQEIPTSRFGLRTSPALH
jgi:hypothetical protein